MHDHQRPSPPVPLPKVEGRLRAKSAIIVAYFSPVTVMSNCRRVSPVTSMWIPPYRAAGSRARGRPIRQAQAVAIEIFVRAEGQEFIFVAEPIGVEVIDRFRPRYSWMSTNVGLTTCLRSTPRASATACTSRVLPAPNVRITPRPSPPGSASASAAPERRFRSSSAAIKEIRFIVDRSSSRFRLPANVPISPNRLFPYSFLFLRRHGREKIIAEIFSGRADHVVEFDGLDPGVERLVVIVSQPEKFINGGLPGLGVDGRVFLGVQGGDGFQGRRIRRRRFCPPSPYPYF